MNGPFVTHFAGPDGDRFNVLIHGYVAVLDEDELRQLSAQALERLAQVRHLREGRAARLRLVEAKP